LSSLTDPAGLALLLKNARLSRKEYGRFGRSYQPYWAVRALLLQRLGNMPEILDAYDSAIVLTEDPDSNERRNQDVH
jgi:predicted RNA polymerase sigma factor